jgi:hypothetical protein
MDQTLKRYETALQAAADAGDTAGATQIAKGMREYMQGLDPSLGTVQPTKLGAEALPETIRKVVRDDGVGEQRLAGIGTAPVLAYQGLLGLGGMSDPQKVAEQKAIRSATMDTTMGNLAGNGLMFGALPARGASGLLRATEAAPWLAERPAVQAVSDALLTRPGMTADTAVTSAVLNAATEPGTPLDRVTAAALGAAGAAVPVGSTAVAQGGRRMATSGGKRIAVAEGLVKETGREDAEKLISKLRDPYQNADLGVKPSAAMLTQDPLLEVMETGSRVRTGDQWRQFDKANAAARFDKLQQAGGSKEELGVMKGERAAKTDPLREEAMDFAEKTAAFMQSADVRPETLKPLTDKLAEMKTGPMRPNKDVQALVGYVEDELKQGVSARQLYELRKYLTEGIAAGRSDALSQSVKAARPQRVEVVGMIDNMLNDLSGGSYGEYMKRYSELSRPITSKQAVQDITEALTRGRAAGETPPALGESPASLTVGRLLARFGEKEFGSKVVDRLTPEHRRVVEAIVDDLKRQQDVMIPRTTLGSPTAPFLANAQRTDGILREAAEQGVASMLPFGNLLSRHAGKAMEKMSARDIERAFLLQNPEEMAKAMEAALRAEAVTKWASRGGAASGGTVSEGLYRR